MPERQNKITNSEEENKTTNKTDELPVNTGSIESNTQISEASKEADHPTNASAQEKNKDK